MKKQLGPKPMILPMPALLVGTYGEDGTPNAMTAAWTAVCCHKPLCVGVAIRHNRLTYANLQKKKAFTLNVPNTSQATSVDYLGTVSGADQPDKISIANLETEKGMKVDAPLITSCPANLECILVDRMVLGSHSWFVGEVMETHVDEAAISTTGGLDIIALDPLVFIPTISQYHALGGKVADAFKIGKTLKK
jgi:flavin reductase (DIM6/NTAB) family NADH-FMN oxidoreductase RutF